MKVNLVTDNNYKRNERDAYFTKIKMTLYYLGYATYKLENTANKHHNHLWFGKGTLQFFFPKKKKKKEKGLFNFKN